MRWSKLYIPTLRDEPAEGEIRLRLLVRAGYARYGEFHPAYLTLGQRTLEKIKAQFVTEFLAIGGQRVALGASDMATVLRGELRSYKQLPQFWFMRSGVGLDVFTLGVSIAEVRKAVKRALERCRVNATCEDGEGDAAPEPFHTPGIKTIAELKAFTGEPETSLIKSLVIREANELVLVLLRGDHTLKGPVQVATAEEIRAKFGADPGSLGPVGVSGIRIWADEALRGRRNMIAGANRDDYHLRGVTPGRDFEVEFRNLRAWPAMWIGEEGVPLVAANGLVMGAIKNVTAGLAVLNEAGGTFEPEATEGHIAFDEVLAALAAQHRDDAGLVMPPMVAPFSVVFTPVNVQDEAQRSTAERLYEEACAAGCDAVLDDRDERPGVKFKDAELIGIPWRVTVGKKLAEGMVEVVERCDKQSWDVPVNEAVAFVRRRWDVIA